MPNERTIQAKKEIVDQLKAKLDSAVTCVVVDYKGISVEDDTKLRKQLREAGRREGRHQVRALEHHHHGAVCGQAGPLL